MQLTIAVIITMDRREGQSRFVAQTVAEPKIIASDVLLKTAIQRLSAEVRKRVQIWVARGHVSELAHWLYDPETIPKVFKETITLRDRTLSLKTILMEREVLGQSIVTAPLIDGLQFQRDRHMTLTQQATQVFAEWCEKKLKQDKSIAFTGFNVTGDVWLEPLDIAITEGKTKKKKKPGPLGALLGQTTVGGAEALQAVGRCLDSHRLERSQVFGRDNETDRLAQLLSSHRKQGVLLVGQSAVGKSAILTEVVRRRTILRRNDRRHFEQTWLISPSRVISGMSYLGEWEQRWLAILKEAYRCDHVLYFDDPIGLYTSGVTRDSDLCLADVLKAFVAEHPVRIVFEMTSEALSILRRRDRSLVDPMVPISIEPMSESATLATLIEVVSQMEADSRCFFQPSLLPKMIEHSSILAPQHALPGRVLAVARGLANQASADAKTNLPSDPAITSNGNSEITLSSMSATSISTDDLNQYIERRTGLRLALRNGTSSIRELSDKLESMVVGQSRAIEVLARYSQRAFQGMQPTDRPLGVFLFTGPTGVGKTESAKALTRLLFHDESRLIRIDMNEVSSSHAAQSLIGTLEFPDGRLPAAIRRQPNGILLLDEIEKANPDVLDYLLQVIGEGRLSDARGRTVDFRNVFIIMTSNFGSAESGQSVGYSADAEAVTQQREAVFMRAAKQYFRPEFLNRIDEIVVFRPLAPNHMCHIVDQHLEWLKSRDGLSRRRVFLRVEEPARQWLIDRGYDPALGARAIKRAIEREVAQPLADQLAAAHVDHPVWTQLRVTNDSMECRSQALTILSHDATVAEFSIDESLPRGKECVERMRKELSLRSPSDAEADRPLSVVDYYAIHGVISEAWDFWKETREQQIVSREGSITPMQPSLKSANSKIVSNSSRGHIPFARFRNERRADLTMREGMEQPRGDSRREDVSVSRQLLRKLALAEMTLRNIDEPQRWLLRCRYLNPPIASQVPRKSPIIRHGLLSFSFFPKQLHLWLGNVFTDLQYSVQHQENNEFMVVEGVSVAGLVHPLLGTYQTATDFGLERLLLIEAMPIPADVTIQDPDANEALLAIFDDPQTGFPSANHSGRDGWTCIRGQFSDMLEDYRSAGRVPLKFSKSWVGWLLDQLPVPPEFVITNRLE